MTTTLLTNIGELVTNDELVDGSMLGIRRNAAILFDERILWTGDAIEAPSADVVIDCEGRAVLPGFVDSHAHLLFGGDRAQEFAARMEGTAYAAGGIRTTVAATRAATDSELRSNLQRLARELTSEGVTHFECKTGYGLTVEDELRGIRIAAEFTNEVTLLAAHVVPPEFADDPDAYVQLIIREMLPQAKGIARWVDVFCDRGAFSIDQTRTLLSAARAHGYELRLHANQLGDSEAVDLAIEFDCASADHCTHLTDRQISELGASDVVVTLLPGAEFSTRSQYPSARRLIDAGVHVAIATDCNPGSSYTTSMPFCIAIAVRDMGFTPSEAVFAATAGGARALRLQDHGHLAVGARANLVVLDAATHIHIAYRPGVPLIRETWKHGTLAFSREARQ